MLYVCYSINDYFVREAGISLIGFFENNPDYEPEEVFFLDTDTVVTGSVAPLGSLDMRGAALGAVVSLWISMDILKGKLTLINGNRKYFNSGVLLYDLATWRREHCHEMIITTLGKEIDLTFPDQNLLNNAIPEQLIRWLPPKYNYRSHSLPPEKERELVRLGSYFTDEEIEESIQSPVIIHYMAGWPSGRPWHEQCTSSRKDDYLRYKALSPWKHIPLLPYVKLKKTEAEAVSEILKNYSNINFDDSATA